MFLVISIIFLILTEYGSTTTKSSVAKKTYFIRINTANVIPVSVPNAVLINSIAQSIGLHDFYQVGLWNTCSGYNGQGVTQCDKPNARFWFDPVATIKADLLQGAVIELPDDINNALNLLRIASHWMFGLFLVGACLEAILAATGFLALYSRLMSLFVGPLTFLAALFTTVAAVLATAIFVILRKAASSVPEINLSSNLGTQMFVFMWMAAGFAIAAAFIQISIMCCCQSRRHYRKSKSYV
jgi:hypothetical protein